ncbi:MAG: protein phosphatase 2C domain-containing protein [Planctomycetaceae bacterium]
MQLSDGEPIDLSIWNGAWPVNSNSCLNTSSHRRVYGFSPASWSVCRESIQKRLAQRLNCLPLIEVVEFEDGAVVVSESLDRSLGDSPLYHGSSHDLLDLGELFRDCENISTAMTELHEAGFVWLNFRPDALVRTSTGLKITSLDLELFAVGECPASMQISSQWSAPETQAFDARLISAATDVYHLGLYAYYSIAGLLENGFSGQGPAAFSFALPQLRVYAPSVLPGLAPVIERAIFRRPGSRFSKPGELIDALRIAVDDARKRTQCIPSAPPKAKLSIGQSFLHACKSIFRLRTKNGDVFRQIETGRIFVAGTAKQSADIPNQDIAEIRVHEFQGQSVYVVVVADGVSTATVGSGDVASKIACHAIHEFIEAKLRVAPKDPDWDAILRDACQSASRQVLDAAIALGDLPAELTDSGIMSSTAVIAIIHGDAVIVANVGDSRAYLVRENLAEQLTVDGDTGTTMLSQRSPPEEVLALGELAKSLQFCLGSCHINQPGELTLNADRCVPTLYRFRLTEGDTVILCTDGLVDEGVFLEPSDLHQLVNEHSALNAQDLAAKLVAEADRKQRGVSETEPKGFGDNISCAVIRFATLKS